MKCASAIFLILATVSSLAASEWSDAYRYSYARQSTPDVEVPEGQWTKLTTLKIYKDSHSNSYFLNGEFPVTMTLTRFCILRGNPEGSIRIILNHSGTLSPRKGDKMVLGNTDFKITKITRFGDRVVNIHLSPSKG